jgi:hypothetical protein
MICHASGKISHGAKWRTLHSPIEIALDFTAGHLSVIKCGHADIRSIVRED